MNQKFKPGTRFRLLVYQKLFQMWFWQSFLLFAASVALVALDPPMLSQVRWWFLPVIFVSAAVMIYALMARYTTYVQAHPRSLRIKSPLFRLVISYGRVNLVRTTPFKVQFPPEKLSWTQRRLANKLYGQTCLVVEVKSYPLSKSFLRLMMHPLLLSNQVTGFTLAVEDWLQLSNEIEWARATWVNRRLMKREKRAVEKILRD